MRADTDDGVETLEMESKTMARRWNRWKRLDLESRYGAEPSRRWT